jgi:integrase
MQVVQTDRKFCERRKCKTKKPQKITNQDAQKIIRRLEYRDKLIIRLAIESGLRINDILKLKNGDINKTMTVYESKSKRSRTFKISDELYADIKKFTKYKKRASYLFPSARKPSKPVHRVTIHRRLKNAVHKKNSGISIHSFRKLYAYNKFAETQSLAAVQDAMHHRKITTTLTYLDIDTKTLRCDMQQDGGTDANT